MNKPPVETVKDHSETVVCPHCSEEFGIESKVQYERELQRDRDADYYERLLQRACYEAAHKVLTAVMQEYPEVARVEPCGTPDETRVAAIRRLAKWIALRDRCLVQIEADGKGE